jgi:hypothetical protein
MSQAFYTGTVPVLYSNLVLVPVCSLRSPRRGGGGDLGDGFGIAVLRG